MYTLTRIGRKEILNKQHFIRIIPITTVVNKVEDQVKPWREIPGPLSLPIIGQLLHFLPGGRLYKRSIELQELLCKNYGPIVRLDGNFGLPPIIFIFDPEAGYNLFRKEDPLPTRPGFDSISYYRKHYINENNEDPSGLILDNGDSWRKFRTLVNPVMLKPKIVKQYTNTMAEVAEEMVKRMKLIRNEENKLESDLYTEITLWALESLAVVALGSRFNCFDPNLPEDSPAKKLTKTLHDLNTAIEELDFQPSLWKYVATPAFKRGMKIYDENTKLSKYFIDEAIDQLKYKGQTSDQSKSILEKLLDIDRDVALVMAGDILFGGIDTIANSTLALLYLLATNPEQQNILREEIMLKQEKKTYIKACIKESFRLLPIVTGTFRQTTKEHDVLGYRIPKDMCVLVGNQNLCLMEEQFPRPKEFIPERWFVRKNDPLYYGNAHRFAYSPFGFGVRGCIGRRLAEMELETIITKMIENFHIECVGPPPKRTRIGGINFLLGPYNFTFKDV